jgi:hypothetical protein
MRPSFATAALLTAAVAAASAPAFGGPAATRAAESPHAYVKTVKCSVATHEAVFHARMRRLEETYRMGMHFTLLERTGESGFAAVSAPGLGRWRRSRPGVSVFGYRQGVRNLRANSVYQMRVDFRWYTREGDVEDQARRRSSACRQYPALPNLRAHVVDALRGAVEGVVRYLVRVSNDGNAAASDVPVALLVDGDFVDTVTVSRLEPGERTLVKISGPACEHVVEVKADPDETIAESSEADNAHTVDCAELDDR